MILTAIVCTWNGENRQKVLSTKSSSAKDLQDLEDGKLNLLGISLPGVGKTTLAIF